MKEGPRIYNIKFGVFPILLSWRSQVGMAFITQNKPFSTHCDQKISEIQIWFNGLPLHDISVPRVPRGRCWMLAPLPILRGPGLQPESKATKQCRFPVTHVRWGGDGFVKTAACTIKKGMCVLLIIDFIR